MTLFIHRQNTKLPKAAQGAVVAIGNFDGVHLGHQALFKATADLARQQNRPAAVLTFEPHPREFFQPEQPPFRLTLLAAKARLMASFAIQHVIALPFDAEMAATTAVDFIEQILIGNLDIGHVIVGDDFCFGKSRVGNVAMLQDKMPVTIVPPVTCDDAQVLSSSRIRHLLQMGDMQAAAKFLGHAWEMEAMVMPGEKRGRKLGYPTANQNVNRYLRLPYGVYASEAMIEGENIWRPAVSNFGIRPMFEMAEPLLETHILDYVGDIYGKIMRLRPVKYLRPEQKFGDIEVLKAQMKQDCIAARAVLESRSVQRKNKI
jgi:riboflavin kinase/FMN adenylyltransferase